MNNIDKKKQNKGVLWEKTNLEFIKSNLSKGISNTVNMLLDKAREGGVEIDFNWNFEELLSPTTVYLTQESILYLTQIKNASFSFTLNCVIASIRKRQNYK